jgi:RNA polymerase sigma-32 factor
VGRQLAAALAGPISEARWLTDDPVTLEDIATELGVSRERVRHIEMRAFQKVQRSAKAHLMALQGSVNQNGLRFDVH